MDKRADKKYYQSDAKKKQFALKSINNYLKQLKMHFELSDKELFDILKNIISKQKTLVISSKKWWNFFQ